MSSRCRICTQEMPKDRKGFEQVCPKCRKEGFLEVYDPAYSYDEERKWLDFCRGICEYHRNTGMYA